jgi:hypothetical protein
LFIPEAALAAQLKFPALSVDNTWPLEPNPVGKVKVKDEANESAALIAT